MRVFDLVPSLVASNYTRFFSLVGILALFILGDSFHYLKYLASFLLIVYVLFSGVQGNSLAVFFLVPAQRFVSFGGFTLVNVVLFYLFFQMLAANAIKIRSSVLLFSVVSLIFLLMVSVFFQSAYSAVVYIKLVLTMLIMSGVVCGADYGDRLRIVLFYLIGASLFALLPVFLLPPGDSVRENWGEVNNPNYVAVLCAFSLSVVLVMRRHLLVDNKFFYLLVLLFVSLGMLTLSRTFLVSLLVLSAYFIFISFAKFSIKFFCGMLALLLMLVSLFLFDEGLNGVLLGLIDRVANPRAGDATGGRLDIWLEYYKYFDSNPLALLVGSDGEAVAGGMSAHNAVIEDLYTYGILGALLVYATVGLFILLSYGNTLAYKVFILPLFVLLLSRMFSHSFLGLEGVAQLTVLTALALVVGELKAKESASHGA